jgi:YD repeat-containing protein
VKKLTRQTTADALGRLTQVVENPGGSPSYSTQYGYDPVDELTSVNQASQTRTFAYDSLQRIMSATNPENGTVSYSLYDSNGNLKTRSDARNTTTSYTYDLLNRITAKSYSDGTPTVSYTYYDPSVTNGKGQLTKSFEFKFGHQLHFVRFRGQCDR